MSFVFKIDEIFSELSLSSSARTISVVAKLFFLSEANLPMKSSNEREDAIIDRRIALNSS